MLNLNKQILKQMTLHCEKYYIGIVKTGAQMNDKKNLFSFKLVTSEEY